MTPAEERSEAARIAVLTSWGRTPSKEERALRTRPAFEARMRRLEEEADPEGVLTPAERAVAAQNLLSAQMLQLSRKSRKVRAQRARRKTA